MLFLLLSIVAPAFLRIASPAVVESSRGDEITRIRLFKEFASESHTGALKAARDSPTLVMPTNSEAATIAVRQSQSLDPNDPLIAQLCGSCVLKCAEVPQLPPLHTHCMPPTLPACLPTQPMPLPQFPPPPPMPRRPIFLPPPMVCPPPPVCPPPQPCPPAPVCPRPAPCPLPQLPPPPVPQPPPPLPSQPLPFLPPFPPPPMPRIKCPPVPLPPAPSLLPTFLPESPPLLIGRPPAVVGAQDCCCNCERICRATGVAASASVRRHLAAALGARTRLGRPVWPFGDAKNYAMEAAALAAEDAGAKCNSRIFRNAIIENISADLEESKRRIQAAAERALGGAPVNVICGAAEFTFVVHAALYCQAGNESAGSCYAFAMYYDNFSNAGK